MNRKIETDLHNILSHVCCAIDYGYYDDVLMADFAKLTGFVSDNEIAEYISHSKSDDYTEEDYSIWLERITDWRDKYTANKAN